MMSDLRIWAFVVLLDAHKGAAQNQARVLGDTIRDARQYGTHSVWAKWTSFLGWIPTDPAQAEFKEY